MTCRYAKQDPANVFYSVKRFIGRTLKEVKQEKTKVSLHCLIKMQSSFCINLISSIIHLRHGM